MTDYDSIWRTQDGSQGSGTVLHFGRCVIKHILFLVQLLFVLYLCNSKHFFDLFYCPL